MTTRDWTARRNGLIYCAPACGGNCTWAAFQAAKRNAAALAKACGPGYTPRVQENLGWHYGALSPCRRIYVYGERGSYSALLGEAGSFSGRYIGHGKTPKQAIVAVVEAARADLASIGALLEGA
jgi:hypothetical protein